MHEKKKSSYFGWWECGFDLKICIIFIKGQKTCFICFVLCFNLSVGFDASLLPPPLLPAREIEKFILVLGCVHLLHQK